ncbi:phosphatidylglycerol lysyltransferase domain-containing protein [Streptomyces yaizuensis]|uniref:Phosphatidylglycerol lysyltransferase domain-containing protein n=1 Tax=Streptomyces yaizuensis TaxID=2989713 RepID=A0ABQ5P0D8_9ACTN|nr:phosphatidylglycerol lysyltransferase domain-containing protein [Streptomyces sp. YSPA8]GLF96073.1 phosphatidylglycerol lysyltransferase domain-containing protein [Streptomyces sp. YSPA8]
MPAPRRAAEAVRRTGRAVLRALRHPRPGAVPAWAARACALAGLVVVVTGLLPALRDSGVYEAATLLPGTTGPFPAALPPAAGVLLLVLAHGLKRGKRRAWRAAVAVLPLGAAGQLLHHDSAAGAVLALAALALLLAHRRHFAALPDPRTRRTAPAALVLLAVASLGLGLAVVAAHSAAPRGEHGLGDLLKHVVYGLVGVEGPLHHGGGTDTAVASCLGALGLLTALTTALLTLRTERPAARLAEDDELRLRALLERHGERDSLGHFALRRDKAAVFSPSGKAAVSYRVVSGVMLASGDPIGDIEAWPGAIERFMAEARAHAWTPAVMGCSLRGGEVWTRETGLDALELGDEAVVDVAGFSLGGRAMRNVRQMVNRIERGGCTTRVRRVRDLGPGELDRIRRAAADWRGTPNERGFSMALGRIGDPADGDAVVATAHQAPEPGAPAPYGDLKAVLHFVPWGGDGMSLELMRRDRAADPGLNELLIVAALKAAPALGVSRVSLNFAMFRAALARGERLGAGPVLRLWRGLLIFLSRWFQIESLYKFNAKFRPGWEPRFVVFPGALDLPRIALAAMRAEGFLDLELPRPLAGRRRRRPPRPCPHVVPLPEKPPAGAARQAVPAA